MPFRLVKLVVCAALSIPMLFTAVQADTLRVGSTPTAVPFNFLDAKTNSLQGVMIDVTAALSKELGFTTEQQTIPLPSLVPSLQTDKIDVISSAFAMSEQRAQVVDFSDVLFTYTEGIIVNAKDSTPYHSVADLTGKVVGVQTGSVLVDPIKSQKGIKEIKMYDTMADMIRDVSLSRIDVAVGDGPVMSYTTKHSGSTKLRAVDDYDAQVKFAIGVAVRKGNSELLARINKGIAQLKADGTLDAILTKWDVKKS